MGTATTPNIGAFGTVAMRNTKYSREKYKQPDNNNNDNWGFFIVFVIVLGTILCLTSCSNNQKPPIVSKHYSPYTTSYNISYIGVDAIGRFSVIAYDITTGNVEINIDRERIKGYYIDSIIYKNINHPVVNVKYSNQHGQFEKMGGYVIVLPLDYKIETISNANY